MPKMELIAFQKYIETFRKMNAFEAEQIHRRLSALGVFQTLLFGAVGLSWQSADFPLLVGLLGSVGRLIAFLTYIGLCCAMASAMKLRHTYNDIKPDNYDGPDVFGIFLEKPTKRWWRIFHYLSAELLVPWVFIAAWGVFMFAFFHGWFGLSFP